MSAMGAKSCPGLISYFGGSYIMPVSDDLTQLAAGLAEDGQHHD
jgi:hypothetical protein